MRKSRNGRGLASMSMSMGMGLGMAFADGRFSGGGSRSVLHTLFLFFFLFDHDDRVLRLRVPGAAVRRARREERRDDDLEDAADGRRLLGRVRFRVLALAPALFLRLVLLFFFAHGFVDSVGQNGHCFRFISSWSISSAVVIVLLSAWKARW